MIFSWRKDLSKASTKPVLMLRLTLDIPESQKKGDTDILDYHPGGPSAVHKSDYWKVYRNGEVQGRIGHGDFTNYDRIFYSPVYINSVLMNAPK